jgi:hypothetical protein
MPDDKTKVGGQDRARIDMSEDYEVRDWTESFGVSKERLQQAVDAAGDRADDVREWLSKNGKSGGLGDAVDNGQAGG